MGYKETLEMDQRACIEFKGGEDEGIKRCRYYLDNHVKDYIDTRNWIMGENYSSKLSPWLAIGALSPRYVFYKTMTFQKMHHDCDKSAQLFMTHLFVRDYARFWALHNGNRIFYEYGASDKREIGPWEVDLDIIKRWRNGQTGMPIIDAFMR